MMFFLEFFLILDLQPTISASVYLAMPILPTALSTLDNIKSMQAQIDACVRDAALVIQAV